MRVYACVCVRFQAEEHGFNVTKIKILSTGQPRRQNKMLAL